MDVNQAGKYLRQEKREEGDGGGTKPALSIDLYGQSDVDGEHEDGVADGQDLGHGQLELLLSEVAGQTEQDEGNGVIYERHGIADGGEDNRDGAGEHHVDTTWTYYCAGHDPALEGNNSVKLY